MRISTIAAIGTLILLSCNSQPPVIKTGAITRKVISQAPDCNVAVRFINDYIAYCLSRTSQSTDSGWIEHNPLLSDNFKAARKKLLDDALKDDPDLGLDFDPVLDAQDFPEKGCELVNCDNKTGYVTVRGKNWPEFVLVVKVAQQGNEWLVDGSGVINIPTGLRAKR
jgi:hypothetical protein